MTIEKVFETKLKQENNIWYGPKGNYWSNLDKADNQKFLEDLPKHGAHETMKKYFPQHEDVIFSLKRAAGLATLEIKTDDTIIDAGCMWGALTIPLARTSAKVIGIDQTEESLKFLNQRKHEENLNNLELVCGDLKELQIKKESVDKVILNGVLEWIPQTENIELNAAIGKQGSITKNMLSILKPGLFSKEPKNQQRDFLLKINKMLKNDGTLYLAIENRYDVFYYFGLKEPHCGIRFISLFPRFIGNIISRILRGTNFENWTYSRNELKSLLIEAGFNTIDIRYSFPGYHHPEFILTEQDFKLYNYCYPWGKTNKLKRVIVRSIELIFYKTLKMKFFSSSFIVLARK